MNTKELIALNNEKRAKLTDENESYYSKMLIYVRLKLQLSEHQSEEILLEILDHLLDGQHEGKVAKDIFGEDPIAYAETLIAQLPTEKKRNMIGFLLKVAGMIIGPVLVIRGFILLLFSTFTEVSDEIPLVTLSITTLLIVLFIMSVITFLLRRLRISLTRDSSVFKEALYAGLYAAVNMGILLLMIHTLPPIGWTFPFSWWASILIGAMIWLLVSFVKKKEKIKIVT